jgi:hypothetical protein
MKKTTLSILKILISIFFITLLLWLMRRNIKEILIMLRATKMWLFCLGFLLYLLNVVIISYRLKRVMTVQDIQLSLKDVTRLSLIGLFFTNFMPTAVGGDVVKAYYTAKSTDKKLESFTSVFMDRMLGLFSFITLATFALVFYGRNIENKTIVLTVFLMLIVSLLGLIILLNKNVAKRLRFILTTLHFVKLDTKLRKIYEAIASYRHHKRIIIQAFYISIICQVLSISIIYLLAKSISVSVPLMVLFLVVPIIVTLSMLPSVNGLGIREGAYVYFLGGIVGREQAFAISLLWLALFLGISLLGGLVYLFWGHHLGTITKEVKGD